jgi:hypothetical protein
MLYQKRSVYLRQMIQIDRNAVFSRKSAGIEWPRQLAAARADVAFPVTRPYSCLAFDADSLFPLAPVNSKLIEKVAMPNHRR